MLFFSWRPFLFLGLCWLTPSVYQAQDEPQTIKIRKESDLVKAVFDNTELRLMVADRFGNPRENKIISFRLYVKNKKESVAFTGFSNRLTPEMISYLNKQTKAAKLFFTEVSAMDDNEHVVKLPDVIDVWFPDCVNCESGRSRKR